MCRFQYFFFTEVSRGASRTSFFVWAFDKNTANPVDDTSGAKKLSSSIVNEVMKFDPKENYQRDLHVIEDKICFSLLKDALWIILSRSLWNGVRYFDKGSGINLPTLENFQSLDLLFIL